MTRPIRAHVRSGDAVRLEGAEPASAQHGATQAPTCEGAAGDAATAALEQIAGLCAGLGRALSALAIEQKRLAACGERALMRPSPSESAGEPAMQKAAKLLSTNDVAERVGVDAHTVRRWRSAGLTPPPIAIGGVIRWRPEVIERWLEEREGGAA